MKILHQQNNTNYRILMIYITFGIVFTLTCIGVLIELFEILPTLSKKSGEKVYSTTSDKTRVRNLEEYYQICKELKKPLYYYYFTNCYFKHARHLLYICLLVWFFSFILMAVF